MSPGVTIAAAVAESAAMQADRVFRSRIDGWLVGVVLVAAAAPLFALVWLLWQGQWAGVTLLAVWGTVMTTVVCVTGFPLRYTLTAEAVHVRSGWLTWEVPYARLRDVRPTWNPLAAPAWSLRRVRLETPEAVILVSPDDRESFIKELAERCPHLARQGDRLSARPSPR